MWVCSVSLYNREWKLLGNRSRMMRVIGALIPHFSRFPLMCENESLLGNSNKLINLQNDVQTFDIFSLENERNLIDFQSDLLLSKSCVGFCMHGWRQVHDESDTCGSQSLTHVRVQVKVRVHMCQFTCVSWWGQVSHVLGGIT